MNVVVYDDDDDDGNNANVHPTNQQATQPANQRHPTDPYNKLYLMYSNFLDLWKTVQPTNQTMYVNVWYGE